MRVLFVSLVGFIAACTATGAETTVAAVGPTHPATQRVIIRPVTASGHAAPGFTVHAQRKDPVDCSYRDPSPGAVNRGIERCSPSYEYAVACWKAAGRGHVLCLRDPTSKRLAKIPTDGKFAATRRPPRAQRAPLLILLTDGTRCSIRDGGAWGIQKSHPRWTGTYSCSRHGVVWAPPKAHHAGVDESQPTWTVRTGRNHGPLVTRHVERAWFVGTSHD